MYRYTRPLLSTIASTTIGTSRLRADRLRWHLRVHVVRRHQVRHRIVIRLHRASERRTSRTIRPPARSLTARPPLNRSASGAIELLQIKSISLEERQMRPALPFRSNRRPQPGLQVSPVAACGPSSPNDRCTSRHTLKSFAHSPQSLQMTRDCRHLDAADRTIQIGREPGPHRRTFGRSEHPRRATTTAANSESGPLHRVTTLRCSALRDPDSFRRICVFAQRFAQGSPPSHQPALHRAEIVRSASRQSLRSQTLQSLAARQPRETPLEEYAKRRQLVPQAVHEPHTHNGDASRAASASAMQKVSPSSFSSCASMVSSCRLCRLHHRR